MVRHQTNEEREQHIIDRRMRGILQSEIMAAIKQGKDPFKAFHDDEIETGELKAGFVLLRGAALHQFHYPRPSDYHFYNDPYTRVPQTMRLSIYTQEEELKEPWVSPSDVTQDRATREIERQKEEAERYKLEMRHIKAYEVGVPYLHQALASAGIAFKPEPVSRLAYGLPGDGTATKVYSRAQMEKYFSAPHLTFLRERLPETFEAKTQLGLMRCIGLVPPDAEMGWKDYLDGKLKNGNTLVFAQDLRRMLSVTLSLLTSYGQTEANREKNGDAIAAWLLDTYNASAALGERLKTDKETQQVVAGLTVLNLSALGASIYLPEDPARLEAPFFLKDVLQGRQGDVKWITNHLNRVAEWNEVVKDEFTQSLLQHVAGIMRDVFPGFGKTQCNALNLGPNVAQIAGDIYKELRGFTPTATEIFKDGLNLDGSAFEKSFPLLAEEFPTLIRCANTLVRADFDLHTASERRVGDNPDGLKAHDELPKVIRNRARNSGNPPGEGGGLPGH